MRCVYELADKLACPLIGLGGVSSGRDVAEMLMAGATAVGVGSAVIDGGPERFGQIRDELEQFMAGHGYAALSGLRSLAHRRR